MCEDLPLIPCLHDMVFMNRVAAPTRKLGGFMGQKNLEEKSGRRYKVLQQLRVTELTQKSVILYWKIAATGDEGDHRGRGQ